MSSLLFLMLSAGLVFVWLTVSLLVGVPSATIWWRRTMHASFAVIALGILMLLRDPSDEPLRVVVLIAGGLIFVTWAFLYKKAYPFEDEAPSPTHQNEKHLDYQEQNPRIPRFM